MDGIKLRLWFLILPFVLGINALGQDVGRFLWNFDTHFPSGLSPALGPSNTVYSCSGTNLFSLSASTGQLLWKWGGPSRILTPPTVGLDGSIYFGCMNGLLYSISPFGTQQWTFATKDSIYSAPSVDEKGNLYFGSDDHRIISLDAQGVFRWDVLTAGEIRCSPALGSKGQVFAGSYDRHLYALRAEDGALLWPPFETADFLHGSAALDVEGNLFFGCIDGKLYALDSNKGTLKWRIKTSGHIYGSPSIALDGTLYIGSWDKHLYAIDTSRGIVKWQFRTANIVQSTPAIAQDGTCIFGIDEEKLIALAPDKSIKWSYPVRSIIRSSPVLMQNGIGIFSSEDGNVFAFKNNSPLAESSWPMLGASPSHRNQTRLTITSQPQKGDVIINKSISFSVGAAGPQPIRFQWQLTRMGMPAANIPNATNAQYTIEDALPEQEGSYRVLVSNPVDQRISAEASLVVIRPPRITTAPQGQTVTAGSMVMFRADFQSEAPVGCQWCFNGTNLPGKTSSLLVLPEVKLQEAGKYMLILTNSAGVTNSGDVVLTVVTPPQITTQPQKIINPAGSSVALKVDVTSQSPVTYQWRFNGQNIANAADSTLTLANIQAANSGDYSVAVMNLAGATTNLIASLLVAVTPTILDFPTNAVGVEGKAITLKVKAAFSGPTTFQWLHDRIPIPGATNEILNMTNIDWRTKGEYSVVVANIAGTNYSHQARVNIIIPPKIITQPDSQTIDAGKTASFQVKANGNRIHYQWYFKGNVISEAIEPTWFFPMSRPPWLGFTRWSSPTMWEASPASLPCWICL